MKEAIITLITFFLYVATWSSGRIAETPGKIESEPRPSSSPCTGNTKSSNQNVPHIGQLKSIGIIAVDPVNPKIIWVATGEIWTKTHVPLASALYKSTDGGETWEKIGIDNYERIGSIVINPQNHDEVYVGVIGQSWSTKNEMGIFMTSDVGKTWRKVISTHPVMGLSSLTARD